MVNTGNTIEHEDTLMDELDRDDAVAAPYVFDLPSIDELVCADDEVRQICDSVCHVMN